MTAYHDSLTHNLWTATHGELEDVQMDLTIRYAGNRVESVTIDRARIGLMGFDRRALSLMCGDALEAMEARIAADWPEEQRRRDEAWRMAEAEARRSGIYDRQRFAAE